MDIVEYQGQSRLTGARANVLSDRRFEGPIPNQLEKARAYLKRRIPKVIRLGGAGRFQEVSTIPEHAWLEAVVNALIHRSYSLGGDHIRVSCIGSTINNVFAYRAMQQRRILCNHADVGTQAVLGDVCNILPINQDAPFADIVEAQQQIDDS